jgi:hypothetical protein
VAIVAFSERDWSSPCRGAGDISEVRSPTTHPVIRAEDFFESFLTAQSSSAARSDFPVSAAHTDLQDAKLRARYRYGLKQIGVFAIALGGISAHAPCWRAGSLIQSALYPRHASNIVCGSKAPRRLAIYGRSVRVGIVPLF